MAWAFVQAATKDAGTSPLTLAFPSNVVAGNLLLVLVSHATSSNASISDTRGSTWAKATDHYNAGNDYKGELWYALAASSGANTVTVTVTGGSNELIIAEYSGAAGASVLDVVANAEGTSTAADAGAMTTTVNGDLIVAGTLSLGAITAATGFTQDKSLTGTTANLALAEQVQGTAGAVHAKATISPSSFWVCLGASFKPAGGTVYNDSVALGLTGGFLGDAGLDITPDALALAVTAAFLGVGGSDFTDSIALAVTGALAQSADITFDLSLALGLTGGYVVVAQADLVGALALGLTGALALANTADFLASLGLAGVSGFDGVGGSDFTDALALAVTVALAVVGDVVVFVPPSTGPARVLIPATTRGYFPGAAPRLYLIPAQNRIRTSPAVARVYIFPANPKEDR